MYVPRPGFSIRSYGAPNGTGRCSVAQCYDIGINHNMVCMLPVQAHTSQCMHVYHFTNARITIYTITPYKYILLDKAYITSIYCTNRYTVITLEDFVYMVKRT